MSSSDDTTDLHGTVPATGTVDERSLGRRGKHDDPITERPEPPALIASRYKTARRIGKGGMGEVMLARDEQVGRDVAIKRMRAARPSERQIQRFLREASIQGRLEHPAIVPVHEIGHDTDGLPFFVMKKLAGTTLAAILEQRRTSSPGSDKQPAFTLQKILRAFVEVCLAVEFAHVRGVVHRDLKPENIMLGDFGEVYVLDWGVAKITDEHDDELSDVDSSGGSGEHATIVGTSIGTPGYMAPEQVRGQADIDGRADVYTLGCLLYEILADTPLHPRGYEGMQSALFMFDNRPSRRAPDRAIPPELDRLCAEATQPERELRVQTARELGDRVQEFLDGDRDLATRRTLAREHLERAREAFEAATGDKRDPDQRSVAMREAAAALALDPAHRGAAELVGRLMIEPPRTTPKEVEDAIAADDMRAARTTALAGLIALATGFAFAPLLLWMAPDGGPWLAVLGAAMLLGCAVSYYNLKAAQPRPGAVVICNALIVAVIAHVYSPVLIAPGLAAAVAIALAFTPRQSWLSSGKAIAISLCIAILVPLGLEQLGWIQSTMRIDPTGGVHFTPPGIGDATTPVLVVSTLYIAGLIVGASLIADLLRARNRASHRALVMQAWQLRQLVPEV